MMNENGRSSSMFTFKSNLLVVELSREPEAQFYAAVTAAHCLAAWLVAEGERGSDVSLRSPFYSEVVALDYTEVESEAGDLSVCRSRVPSFRVRRYPNSLWSPGADFLRCRIS